MAKSKKSKQKPSSIDESDSAPILEVGFSEPLFSLAAHPTKPIIVTGLATGHVHCNTYNAEALEEFHKGLKDRKADKAESKSIKSSNKGSEIKTWSFVKDHSDLSDNVNIVDNWKTKRHKGSCRSVIFDPLVDSVGESIYSVGTDHVIKKANTETGKVTAKAKISDDKNMISDAVTRMIHSPSHPFLLTGLESGGVHVYDSKNLNSKPLKFKVPSVHSDAVNYLCPMPAVSAYHYLSLGSTTLSHIDIRKGVVTQSDDQEDELLTMCFPNEFINHNKNDTVLVSHGEGIVTLWKNSKNGFSDQISRIKINKDASIDAMIPTMNDQDDDTLKSVWCGDSEGLIHRFNYSSGKIVERRVHSEVTSKHGAIDEVGMLEIDYNYRLISAGMETLKIWPEISNEDDLSLSDVDESSSDRSDDYSDSELDSNMSSLSNSDAEENLDEIEIEESPVRPESEAEDSSKSELLSSYAGKKKEEQKAVRDEDSEDTHLDKKTNDNEPPQKKAKLPKQEPKVKAKMSRQEHGIKRFEGL